MQFPPSVWALATAAIGLAVLTAGCVPLFDCENELLESKPNGDGLVAVVFERGCGATTANSYHISILLDGEKLGNHETGDVYITEDPIHAIKWENPRVLEIETTSSTSFLQEQRVLNVEIRYRLIEGNSNSNQITETNQAEHAER